MELESFISANIYLFKVNYRDTRKMCEIYSKFTKKHQNDVNDVVLEFLLLTLNIFTPFSSVSIVDFEQGNVTWNVKALVITYISSHHSFSNSI